MAEHPLPEFDKAMAEWNESMARWRVTLHDFGKTLERIERSRKSLFSRLYFHLVGRPSLADQLAECSRQLWASERRRARAEGQLDHYIGQAIRARAERDQFEAALRRALPEHIALTDRVCQLGRDLAAVERSRENLTAIADGLRDELRELRAGIAVGALHRKGTR